MFGSSQWMYSSGGGFYDTKINGSLRFNDDDSAYLSRTPASAGNRKTWTWSGWVKRSKIGSYYMILASDNNDYIRFDPDTVGMQSGNTAPMNVKTTAVLRDPSAWYHLVFALDTTQATPSDRFKIYINGTQATDFSATTYPALNAEFNINNTTTQYLGRRFSPAEQYFDGYMAEVNFIDGQSLAPTSFGETKSGVWISKAYSGSYGTNGFRLKFAGNANDSSGNGNNWTETNISSYDYVPDSPTNNFSTLNPLWTYNSANSGTTYSQGNLQYAMTSSNSRGAATMEVLADGCYFEMMARSSTCAIGVQSIDGSTTHTWNAVNSGELSNIGGTDPDGFTTGDVVAVAVGTDGNIKLYKNGTLQGSDNTLTGYTAGTPLVPLLGEFATAASNTIIANFGQDSTFTGLTTAGGNSDANGYGDFKYSVPSGYLALCTENLTVAEAVDPAEDNSPQDHFSTYLYIGNGSSRSISGVGFSPDWVWIKARNWAHNPEVYDIVRGPQKGLMPSGTDSEFTRGVTSFDSDGFSLDSSVYTNQNGVNFVAWTWEANGSGVSNNVGSIPSTVSANTGSGFSIGTFVGNQTAGATVGHGLSQAPEMIIIKDRPTANDWPVYHTSISPSQTIKLNSSNAAFTESTIWNNTAPTTSVFTLGSSNLANNNTKSHVFYAFHSVEGFSSFGKYFGNGSTDGPFVYTGFRPAFVICKKTSAAENWSQSDSARSPYNVAQAGLSPSTSNTENTTNGWRIDLLSNGFKPRDGAGQFNDNGATYIYMAFAENPFKYANAR